MKFEHLAEVVETDNDQILQKRLDELGEEGWELIHVRTERSTPFSLLTMYQLFFKRVKNNQ
ncbi:hypothetical protein OAH30_03810 [Candidatus Pelagibacter sp.]|jgi:ribose 1,5-bisphosphokinase PhnN|nr:hypothetical protein [Candidatus Pelagibacter sp.]